MKTIAPLLLTCLFVLPAHAKYSGGTGEPNDPYQIATAEDLIALGETPADYDKHFVLTADIDLDPNLPGRKVFDRAVIAPDANETNAGWYVYFDGTPFTGVFDGDGHTILHLAIKGKDYVGLFGQFLGEVKNLGVLDVRIVGSGSYAGGLVGSNGGRGTWRWESGTVVNCCSGGAVSGTSSVGGLVGRNVGTIRDSYAAGSVAGDSRVGGLVGTNGVMEGVLAGGYPGKVSNCYSVADVRGVGPWVGGLLGCNECGEVMYCFWDTETSGQGTSAGGTGKTTAEMHMGSSFFAWGCTPAVWTIDEGGDYPGLAWEGKPGKALPALADFLAGSGGPADPYLIRTADDLNTIGLFPCDWDKHFKLVADIDLSAFDGKEGRPAFNIIGDCNRVDNPLDGYWLGGTAFLGIFDGNGHTISHLTVRKHSGCAGLFGGLESGGQVKNLGVVDVNITGSGDAVGGLVGYNGDGGTVTNCYSTGAVGGEEQVGGLVGINEGTVARCYGTAAVSGSQDVGGLVGYNSSYGSVSQSYSTGAVTGKGGVGGLVGYNEDGGTVTNCYSAGAVGGEALVGGLVGWGYIWGVTASFWDIQTSGQDTSVGGKGLKTAQMQTAKTFLGWGACGPWWKIVEGQDYPHLAWEEAPGQLIPAPTYGGGMGTAQDPYLIYTAEELDTVGRSVCDWGKHFKLMADIDLSGFDGKDGRPGFNSIGAVGCGFSGIFDGNGYTIAHLTIVGEDYLGLFGVLASGAEIKNLGVVDVNITGSGGSVGGLVGSNGTAMSGVYGIVADCYSTGSIKGDSHVGGLVGFNLGGTVTRCHSACSVRGNSHIGGLVGENWDTVTQSYSDGAVSGGEDVGGLVGCNWRATVTDCYSTATVTGHTCVGGLVGDNWTGWEAGVTQCYSTGAVSAKYGGRGLVGNSTANGPLVNACFWDTETSKQTASSGGGTGRTTAEMQTAKTFLEAGWDFVGETANGTEDIWWIDEGKDYPRLWWELTAKK
jgi:hypothetical protein